MPERLDGIIEQALFIIGEKGRVSTRNVLEHALFTGDNRAATYFYETYEDDSMRIERDGRVIAGVVDRQSLTILYQGKTVFEARYDGMWKVTMKDPSAPWKTDLGIEHHAGAHKDSNTHKP